MDGAEVIDVAREALWVTFAASAPVMGVGLVVGLSIALLQALTQVQEMTLVFVPKIVAIFGALLLFAPLMAALLGALATDIFARIAAM
ncbi:MAG: flagellar biosynthesis protein FliQ [Caulobacterales bacterium]|nr:flagellar biosynthesis protein FliQ [Caulobacterales bacterium]